MVGDPCGYMMPKHIKHDFGLNPFITRRKFLNSILICSYFPQEKGIRTSGELLLSSLFGSFEKRGIRLCLKMPLSPFKELKPILSVPFLIELLSEHFIVTTATTNFSCFFLLG